MHSGYSCRGWSYLDSPVTPPPRSAEREAGHAPGAREPLIGLNLREAEGLVGLGELADAAIVWSDGVRHGPGSCTAARQPRYARARRASIASQMSASMWRPSNRATSCNPVGEVTLISVK